MKNQCSSAKNDTSNDVLNFKSPYEIQYDATYKSLKFDYNLACTYCIRKMDIFCKTTSSKKS